MRLHTTLLLGIALICTACAGIASPPTAAQYFNALPFPADRRASVVDATRLGKDAEQRSAGAIEAGNALTLAAGANGLEYAVYRFTPVAAPLSVEVTLDSSASSGAFICLADFTQQHWQFTGPFSTTQTITVNSALHLSPLGNVFIAIVAGPGASAKIDQVKLTSTENLLPTASFTVDPPAGGPAPLTAQFDASASSDSDGSIAKYEWDFDNDGSFETDMGTNSNASRQFDLPGEYPVTLRVTDDDAATATTQQTVTAHGWLLVAVSSPGAYTPTLLIAGGYPAIGFWDGSDLRYARSTTARGTALSDWEVITAVPGGGSYLSFALIGGNPAASFTDYSTPNKSLRYVRSTTAAGISPVDWTQSATVDPGLPGSVGFLSSLTEVNGSPALAYNEIAEAQLRYARATSADGALSADWSQRALVDNDVAGGYEPSLHVIAGNPAIAYRNSSVLGYARATTADGALTADWSQLVTPVAGSNAVYMTLCTVGGNPAIGYIELQDLTLRFVRATSADGALAADWSIALSLLGTTEEHARPRLAVVGTHPAIAYYDQGDNHLKYAAATTDGALLADWSDKSTINSATNGGEELSLAEVDGHAAVAFCGDSLGNDRGVNYAILY